MNNVKHTNDCMSKSEILAQLSEPNHVHGNLTKLCIKCNRDLPLSEFNHDKKIRDFHSNQCRDCEKISYNT